METRTYPILSPRACTVPGVRIALENTAERYEEAYFSWQPMALCACFVDGQVSGGYIEAYRHLPVYRELEFHADTEVFFFVSGEVIMPVCALKDGAPDMESLQFLRIPEKTQLILEKGVGHFVPVAADCLNAKMVVVAPKMDAPRVALPYPVQGV